jgi:hypothetical protein
VLRVVIEYCVAWHKVPESDGGERDEGEVGALEQTPLFPRREEDGAAKDVEEDEGEDGQHGDALVHHVVVQDELSRGGGIGGGRSVASLRVLLLPNRNSCRDVVFRTDFVLSKANIAIFCVWQKKVKVLNNYVPKIKLKF